MILSLCLQGKEDYNEILFITFKLSKHVPTTYFYRWLKEVLDLRFMRITAEYPTSSGQKSLDPGVIMKLQQVRNLENIPSDRLVMSHCARRLDILYFLGYDLDEPRPWPSTLSRAQDLIPGQVFVKAFEHVLEMCIIMECFVAGVRCPTRHP